MQRIWPDYGGAKDRGQIGTVTWVSEDKSHIKVTLSTGGLPPPGSARAARGAAASTPKGKEIVVLSAKFKPAGNVMTSQLAKGMSERFTKEHRVNEQPRPLPQRTEDSIIAHHVSERPRLTPSQSRTSVAPSSTTSSSRRAAASSSSSTTSSSTAASSGPAGGAAPPQSSRYEQVWVRALVSQNKVTTPGTLSCFMCGCDMMRVVLFLSFADGRVLISNDVNVSSVSPSLLYLPSFPPLLSPILPPPHQVAIKCPSLSAWSSPLRCAQSLTETPQETLRGLLPVMPPPLPLPVDLRRYLCSRRGRREVELVLRQQGRGEENVGRPWHRMHIDNHHHYQYHSHRHLWRDQHIQVHARACSTSTNELSVSPSSIQCPSAVSFCKLLLL